MEELGRSVNAGAKGIRILAPIVGVQPQEGRRSREGHHQAEHPRLVGFRNAYVFDVSQTNGVDLPDLHEVSGDLGESIDRLSAFLKAQGIQLVYNEKIAPALGMSYGGRIAILPGQSKAEEFSTLVHETAHEMLHKAERRTATTKTVRETEAEAVAFVVGKAVGLVTGNASADYIHLYHGNASLLAESLEVIQQTSSVILAALEPPSQAEDSDRHRCRTCGGGVMKTILDILEQGRGLAPRPLSQDREPAVHGARHRGDGRIRPVGLPALSVAHYGEQNGDLDARPGDVLRAWHGRRRAPEPVLLAQRLRGGRAVEPQYHSRATTCYLVATCTSSTHASPRRGTTTCDCKALPKPSRTSRIRG